MYSNLPFIFEGEILEVEKYVPGDSVSIRYTCIVTLANGSRTIIPGVREINMFGGIDNYMRHRLAAHSDDSESKTAALKSDYGNIQGAIGARVFITFIGGHLTNPVIIGYDHHPNQAKELPDQVDKGPSLVFQYNGVRVTINEDGDLTFIHKGKPEIKFAPKTGLALPSLPTGLDGNPELGGNESPAITPASEEEITVLEMTKGGVYRVRDSQGQMIEIDRTKNQINITNEGIKSTDAADGGLGGALSTGSSPSSESITLKQDDQQLDIGARKKLTLTSGDAREDKTTGKYTHDVTDEQSVKIGKNNTTDISGSNKTSIQMNDERSVNGKVTDDVKSAWTIKVGTEFSVKDSAGAGISVKGGKVAIGGATAELFDSVIQALDALIQNAPSLVATSVGPGALNPAVVTLLTTLKTGLTTIKGSL